MAQPTGEGTDDSAGKIDVKVTTGTPADKDGVSTADKDADKAPKDDDTSGLKKALAATRKERDDLLKAQRDAELAKLPELEKAKAVAEQLAKDNAKLKTDNMRRQIGMELGLPWNLAKRISGDTEDAMREDAADLLKSYKPKDEALLKDKDDPKNKKPPTNDGKAKGSGAGGYNMTQLLRMAAGKPAGN